MRTDLLTRSCAQAGISLIHSIPYDSPSHGKVERKAYPSFSVRKKSRRVIAIKPFWDAVGQEGLLENDGQGADCLGGVEGMTDRHTGVVIEDRAENGLD